MCSRILGYMPMPENFKYRKVFLAGKPRHDASDAFRLRHPSMDLSRRARIFAPFDALRGFRFAIMEQEVLHAESLRMEEERYGGSPDIQIEGLHGEGFPAEEECREEFLPAEETY